MSKRDGFLLTTSEFLRLKDKFYPKGSYRGHDLTGWVAVFWNNYETEKHLVGNEGSEKLVATDESFCRILNTSTHCNGDYEFVFREFTKQHDVFVVRVF